MPWERILIEPPVDRSVVVAMSNSSDSDDSGGRWVKSSQVMASIS